MVNPTTGRFVGAALGLAVLLLFAGKGLLTKALAALLLVAGLAGLLWSVRRKGGGE